MLEKQRATLNRWPVLVPSTVAVWLDDDVTTEDGSPIETYFGDY